MKKLIKVLSYLNPIKTTKAAIRHVKTVIAREVLKNIDELQKPNLKDWMNHL